MDETKTIATPEAIKDCERLKDRLQGTAQRLENQVVRLSKIATRLYSQPRDEKPDKQARGEGWIEDIDGAIDDIDILVRDFETELDQLNRFME